METETKPLKTIADELMQIKGNVRGEMFRTHAKFIAHKQGREAIKLVEQKMAELGYPIEFGKIKAMDWKPEGLSVLAIVVAHEIFNWTEKDVYELGLATTKFSFLVRLLTKFFRDPRRGYLESPKYWKMYFDIGKFEAPEWNEKEKYCVVRLSDYKTHPLACVFLSGTFVTFGYMVNLGKNVTIEEVKCPHKGDAYHEWRVYWQ